MSRLRRWRRLAGTQRHRECPNRLIETLELPLSQTLVVERHALRHRLRRRPLNHHATGFGKLLQSLRQHHPRARHGGVGEHLLPERNAHARPRHDLVTESGVVLGIGLLELQRRTHRIRGTREFGDQRIAPYLVDCPAVGVNRLGEASKGVVNARVGQRFVATHECRRADDIGMQNNRQFARLLLFHQASRGHGAVTVDIIVTQGRGGERIAAVRAAADVLIAVVPIGRRAAHRRSRPEDTAKRADCPQASHSRALFRYSQ